MPERRNPKVKIGRRKTDIPIVALERFKDEMKEHMEETVQASIEKHVNGGIRGLRKDLEDYIKSDTEWKADLEWLKNVSQGARLLKSPIIWMAAFILGLVALMGGVKTLAAGFFTWVIPK